jgi:glycerol-3-phosphate acyltransferase PlsY
VTYALLVLSYVLGATPTSYWVGKAFHGVDLREHGSGNLGATNAFRVLGWQSALPVMVVDIAKGVLPVWLFPKLEPVSVEWVLAFGAAAIVGHVFSFWVGFKGGKGVATGAGVFVALAPVAALGSFAVWLALAFTTRIVSVASMGAAATLPVLVALTGPRDDGNLSVWFATTLGAFVIWAHRSNFRRLLKGEESRIGRSGGSAPDQEKESDGEDAP